MNDYEERKQARIDRYREKAEKSRQQSSQLSHESVSMLEHIPPGQPILVTTPCRALAMACWCCFSLWACSSPPPLFGRSSGLNMP